MIEIRRVTKKDWPSIWQIIKPVFQAGTTYPFAPDIDMTEAYQIWLDQPSATYLATENEADILGTYYIKPNQPGLGSHVCNCGYIVAEHARGRGVATAMCKHSQHQAAELGFTAMQFNLVVVTNTTAVHLWQKLGFNVIGILPKAFQHSQHGLVDAMVMYKLLTPQ